LFTHEGEQTDLVGGMVMRFAMVDVDDADDVSAADQGTERKAS